MKKRRPKKKRQLKKTVYIVCEGENTEPVYLGAMAEKTENTTGYAFHVVVHHTSKNHPLGLIEEARKLLKKNDGDEAWAVFDKDGYTKHHDAFRLAQSERYPVNIAFSSIAFEHWVLLHFEQNAKAYKKSRNVIIHIENQKYISHYSKGATFNLFRHLQEKSLTAIENAAWLRHRQQNALREKGKIFRINPYTTIDNLVKLLLNIETEFVWLETGDCITRNNCEITLVEKQQHENQFAFTIRIANNETTSLIINPQNHLFVNNNNAMLQLSEKKTIKLKNSEVKTLQATVTLRTFVPDIRVYFVLKNTRFVMQYLVS